MRAKGFARQNIRHARGSRSARKVSVFCKPLLHTLKQCFVDYGGICVIAEPAAERKFARIFRIGQPLVESPALERLAVKACAARVECGGNVLLFNTLVVFRENVADNFGLFLVNLDKLCKPVPSANARGRFLAQFITVHEMTAAKRTVCNTCVKPVSHALGKAFAILFVIPFKEHFIKFAALVVADGLCCRYYPNAVFLFQHFFIHDTVAAVTGKAVEHIHDYVLKLPACGVLNHTLKGGAAVVRPRLALSG